MTNPEKMLATAAELSEVFSAGTLVMHAWLAYPGSFSLEDYQHPDSNKALSYLMGEKGLVARGYLKRVAPRHYSLTDAGREVVGRLKAGSAVPPLTSDLTNERLAEMRSIADRMAVSFADACAFWGLVEGDGVKTKLMGVACMLARRGETRLLAAHRKFKRVYRQHLKVFDAKAKA